MKRIIDIEPILNNSMFHTWKKKDLVYALKEAEIIPCRWISVNEKLPEIPQDKFYGECGSVKCLVTVMANQPTTLAMEYEQAKIRGKVVCRWKWNDRISPWEVMHWMYFPEPYKE